MGDAHAAAATTLSALPPSAAASISTGMGFKDVTTAIEFVRSHALHQNKQLRDDGKTRCGTFRKLVCFCKDCPFFVRFKKRPTGELPWVIVAMDLFHAPSCTSVANPKPRELVQLDVFKNVMMANPSISASKLAKIIQDESGMEVEAHTADRARRLLTQSAETSDAGSGLARKRGREGEAVDAVKESDSATTNRGSEFALLMGIRFDPSDPLPPLRNHPPAFHSTGDSGASRVQNLECALEQRKSIFNRAQLTADSLQRLLQDFEHLNDGSTVRCECHIRGGFVRAFASCGVFTRASSRNQQIFGFECVAAYENAPMVRGYHMYLLGKDANMETVVLAVAVVGGCEATLLDHHEWFFWCVLNTAAGIKTGVVIATLTSALLVVTPGLGSD